MTEPAVSLFTTQIARALLSRIGIMVWLRIAVFCFTCLFLISAGAQEPHIEKPEEFGWNSNYWSIQEWEDKELLSESVLADLAEAESLGESGEFEASLQLYLDLARINLQKPIVDRAQAVAEQLLDIEAIAEIALMQLQLDPDSLDVRHFAVNAMVGIGEIEAGFEIARHTADSFASVRNLAVRTAQNGTASQQRWLLDEINEVIALVSGQEVELYLGKAALLVSLRELDGAEEALAYGLAIDPEHIETNQMLAEVYSRQNRSQDSLILLERLIELNPEDMDIRRQYGFQLLQLDPALAIEEFEQLLEQFPQQADILIPLAQIYLAQNDIDSVERTLLRLNEIEGYESTAAFRLAEISELRDDLEAAIEQYKAVGPGELFPEAIVRLSGMLLRDSRIEELDEHFQYLQTEHPDIALSLVQMHTAVLRNNQFYDQAIKIITSALSQEEFEGNSDLLYDRSLLHSMLGDLDSAEQDLRTVIEQQPDNDNALNALGYSLLEDPSRLDEAIDLITRALEIEPDDPATIDSMGWALYKQGKYEAALPYLEMALQMYYDSEVIEHVAKTLDKLNRREDALALVRRALQDMPDDQRLLDTLIYLGDSY